MNDQTQATVNINTNLPAGRQGKKIKSITLDGGIYMDADESNNVWSK